MKKNPLGLKAAHIRLALKLILQNWYLLFLIIPAAYCIAYLYSYRLNNVYKAKTQILLKSENKYDVGSKIYQGFSGYDAYADQSNQKRVLGSYDLINKVVTRCNFGTAYYLVGRLKTNELYKSAPFRVEILAIDSRLAKKAIGISFSKKNISLSYELAGDKITQTYPYSKKISNKYVSLLLSTADPEKELNSLKKFEGIKYEVRHRPNRDLVEYYRGALAVKGEDYTSILDISVEDYVQERAIDFLDTLYHAYSNYSVKQRLFVNSNTLSFIDKQMDELLAVINGVENDLESYKAKEDILNLNQEETQYYSKMLAFDEQSQRLNMQLKTIEQLENFVEQAKDENLVPPAFYIPEGDAYLSKTLNQLYDMQLRKNEELYDFKLNNPSVKRNERAYELIKRDMLKYLAQSKKAIQDKINELRRSSKIYENLLREVPKSQRQILNIKRRIDVNEKLYQYLLEQRANIAIERSSIVPETEILEKPRSLGVVRPNRSSIINTGLFLGFVLVVLIAAIRFFIFDRLESVAEVKDYTNLIVSGSIPLVKVKPSFGTAEYLKSDLAEAYRRLRSNLQFSGLNLDKKTILISSLYPGEGKTFTSVNLAYMSALAGMRVVLVDLDLHKPNVHKTIGVSNTDRAASIALLELGETSAYTQQLLPNLDVITAGKLPPNASEIIMNPNTSVFIERLKLEYDLVILDTPPLHLITDARSLMRYSDINLLVLNARNATRSRVGDLEELQLEGDIKNFSIILNGLKIKRWQYIYGKYNYKYAYKYGYGYGYNYGENKA